MMEKDHKVRNPKRKHSFKQTYTFSRTVEPSKYNVYKKQPKLLRTVSAKRNIDLPTRLNTNVQNCVFRLFQ